MSAAEATESRPESSGRLTAGDVKDALHRRYNKPSQGRPGEQYVCIEEARSGAGFSGNSGQCDFLAINTWQGRGMELIGHEVKVSMSDWKAELANPEKAEVFARFCRRWYVAVPSDLAKKIADEVPPMWGLLSVSAARITEVRKAKAREPEPVPPWWWIGWLSQIDRQHKRRLPDLIRDGMANERATIEQRIRRQIEETNSYQAKRDEALKENVAALKEATGLDLRHVWSGQFKDLGRAWQLVQSAPSFDGLVTNLRRAADALEALHDAPDASGSDDPAEVRASDEPDSAVSKEGL